MADYDDIEWSNDSLPHFPKEMNIFQKIMCLFGHHKWEKRQTSKGHCYGFETEEGKERGIKGIHDKDPMKLRDQCSRCCSLK